MKFARLKPYNGKAHVLRSFTVFGIKFLEARGWYQVEDDVAAYLKTCVQVQEDTTSQKAFDVVDDLEEAEEIDELEKRKAERAKAAEARVATRTHAPSKVEAKRASDGTLTTKDLPGNQPKSDFDSMKGTFDEDMSGRPTKPTVAADGADEDGEPEGEETAATDNEATPAPVKAEKPAKASSSSSSSRRNR